MKNKLSDIINHVDTGDWISSFILDVKEGTFHYSERLRDLTGSSLAFVDFLHEIGDGFIIVVLSLKVFCFGLPLYIVPDQ